MSPLSYVDHNLSLTLNCGQDISDITRAVHSIMRAENWILDRLPKDQTLVILLGEFHANEAHTSLQVNLLKAHKEQYRAGGGRSFAFGEEYPHNYIQASENRKYVPLKNRFFRSDDPDGTIALTTQKKWIEAHGMHSPTTNLINYCLNENVSVSFNDVANVMDPQTGIRFFDQKDAFTKSLVERHKPALLGKDIIRGAPTTPEGMMLSNLAMAENALEHIKRSQSRVYIQLCGNNHVVGQKNSMMPQLDFKFEDSLSMAFYKKGCAVLPVLLDVGTYKAFLPKEASVILDHSMKINFR